MLALHLEMQNEKWEKIIEVFNSALDEKESERRAFVEMQMNGEDEDALQEVLELLSSHEESEDFIEEPPSELAAEVFENGNRSSIGKTIGVYKIEKEIGHGGMGTVFLATRSDKEFDQKVAIKLLKRGMDTDAIILRFRYERQILAELNHPNIARLLDGGTTKNGLPYFVLEYIEGVPITEYCEQKKLELTERLKLFRQVCDAISYAHQNLIVHRDIKPNNILVNKEGVPKLLDFGIAKVLQTDSDTTNLTVAGERLMTPKYASPEQVKGEPITTATDVYSLGVLLYELLTGTLPYKIESASPKQIEEIISEKEPTLPSKEINPKSEIQNPKSLKGDLDNIALMALEKEPSKRYQNVGEFSSDIGRYLKGLPVIARKNTFVYRATKFVRRNAIAVAVAGIFSVFLIGFLINSQVQANRIAKEQKRSEKVLVFMKDIFKGNDPANAGKNDVSAREILDRGVLKIESELKNEPDVQAELFDTVGQVYQSLGEYEKAETLLEKSLQIRRDFFGENSKEIAQTLLHLGDVQRVRAKFDDAEKNLKKSLEIRRNLFGEKSKEVIPALYGLVSMNFDKKDFKTAESLAKERLEISRANFGDNHKETVGSLRDLGDVQMNLNELENAEKNIREAVKIGDSLENLSEEVIDSNILLARLLFFKKREFEESKKLLNKSQKLGKEFYGETHPQMIWILTNQAFHSEEQKKYDDAIEITNEIIDLQKKLYGEKHSLIASAINRKASFYFRKEDWDEAEKFWQDALKMRKETLGEKHPSVTEILSNLGLVSFEKGEYKKATETFESSLEIQRETMKETDYQIGFSLIGLGKSMTADGQAKNAEAILRKGVGILENSFFKNTWYFADAQAELGFCLVKLNKFAEAEKVLNASLEKIEEKYGENHKRTKKVKGVLEKAEKLRI